MNGSCEVHHRNIDDEAAARGRGGRQRVPSAVPAFPLPASQRGAVARGDRAAV